MYDFSGLKKKVAETNEWLQREYSGIRTSRATPALLESVTVEVYGSIVPLHQAATISIENARTLRVIPYDLSQIKEIEKGITRANLGVSIASDERGARVSFPELTGERREQLLKLVKDKLEEARVSLRGERDQIWSDIQRQEKAGEITEDEKFRNKDDMQKIIDDGNKQIDILTEKKEKEILS